MTEFNNLSDRIYADGTRLLVEDFKEFIKRFRKKIDFEDFMDNHIKKGLDFETYLKMELDKLVGEKLIQ